MIVHFMFTSNTYIYCIYILNQPFFHIKCVKLAWTKGLTAYNCRHPSLWNPKTGPGCHNIILLKCKNIFNFASCLELVKVVRRPWAPRNFLEFAVKNGYDLDPWKTFCCPWVFRGGLWTGVDVFFYWTIDCIKHSRVKIKCCRVIKQNNV